MSRTFVLILLSIAPLISLAQEPSHEDAARELLALMRADQVIEQTYAQILPFFQDMLTKEDADEGRREIFERHFKRMMDAMVEEMNWEKLEPLMIDAYTTVYSEEELRELSQFYASPIGQKLVAKTPEMAQISMGLAQQLMESFVPRLEELQGDLRDDLEAYAVMKKVQENGTD